MNSPGIAESCGVTTVYVTIVPTSSITTVVQLPNTPVVNYGGVANSGSTSILGSGSGIDSTSIAHLTSTVHETVFLTSTMTGTGTTRTETTEVTYPTSPPVPAGYAPQSYASIIESMNSADVIMASSSSMTLSQAISTASGRYFYPTVTIEAQISCSGDLVTCPETSALNIVSSLSAESITISQLSGSTSTPPEVYVIETLTVIPLATLPTVLSSSSQTTTSSTQTTVFSTAQVILSSLATSAPVITRIVYATGLSGTAISSSSPPSGSYPSLGAGGWNMSIPSSSVTMSTSRLASIGTGISTTLAADALSNAASPISSYSPASMNFSSYYLHPNVTSKLVAQSAFTASPISSTSTEAPTSSGFQTTQVAFTESCTDTKSPTSAINALQSTTTTANVTASFITSLPTPYSTAQTTSEVVWTESCSEGNSAPSTVDAGQSNLMSMTGVSSSSSSSTPYSSTSSFLNSTSLSSYTFSTTLATSSGTTSTVSSIQSASSGFSTSVLPSLGSISTGTYSPQIFSSSTAASTLATATNMAKASSFSSATFESTTMTVQGLTTSLLPTTASSTSPAEDTVTQSIAPSSASTSATPNSSIFTFNTLMSSASLVISSSSTSASSITALSAMTASPTSSSSSKPTLCGEHGAFTLNVKCGSSV